MIYGTIWLFLVKISRSICLFNSCLVFLLLLKLELDIRLYFKSYMDYVENPFSLIGFFKEPRQCDTPFRGIRAIGCIIHRICYLACCLIAGGCVLMWMSSSYDLIILANEYAFTIPN